MESRSQNDSDGGGGGSAGSTSSSAGRLRALRDVGRSQPRPPQAQDGPQNLGSNAVQLPAPAPPVLSLDQIRVTRNSNEYTDGPTVAPRSPATQPSQQHKNNLVISPPDTNEQHGTRDERPNNLRNQQNLLPSNQHSTIHSAVPSREGMLRPSSAEDSRSSLSTGTGSTSSGQRLSGGDPVVGERIIRTQPKHVELKPDELKPLNDAVSRTVVSVPGGAGGGLLDKHTYRCEDCGRCRCPECVRPRTLPSCWLCGRRCMCSARNIVEYGTCACCVKGLFYHCSSDDEDTCADKPFSCTQSHCCVRWTIVSLLSLCLPCLLCYLPAKGCLAACQSCYDRAMRPGCRCKNTSVVHCKSVDKPT